MAAGPPWRQPRGSRLIALFDERVRGGPRDGDDGRPRRCGSWFGRGQCAGFNFNQLFLLLSLGWRRNFMTALGHMIPLASSYTGREQMCLFAACLREPTPRGSYS